MELQYLERKRQLQMGGSEEPPKKKKKFVHEGIETVIVLPVTTLDTSQ